MREYRYYSIDQAEAQRHIKRPMLPRVYTRFQKAYCNDNLIAVICWSGNEPHVEYMDGFSARDKLEGTIDFVNKCDGVVIRTLRQYKRLFDAVTNRTKLKYSTRSLDIFGRGVEYIYEAKTC